MKLKSQLQLLSIILFIVLLTGFTFIDDWFLYKNEELGYKIEFPKEPTAAPQIIDSEIGPLKMNLVMYDASQLGGDDNLVYLANATEYPDSTINSNNTEMLEGYFRKSIDGAVANVNGKLLTEEVKNLGNYPGREITVDYANGMAIIRMRMYLVENVAYMTQTITEAAKDGNASISRFMDSFELIL